MNTRVRSGAKRRASIISGLLIGAVLLSACSGNSSEEAAEKVTSDDLISSMPTAKSDVDLVTWNLTAGEPDTLDPANAATYSGGQVVKNLCDSLSSMDADFNQGPGLAESDQVSPTKLVYTLRPDAKFWDGTTVTAEDVAYSLNRAAKPDKIISYIFENVKSIEATNEREVTVTFTRPDELFNQEMAGIAGVVMEKGFSKKAGADLGSPKGGLMCSGPFKLGDWASGDGLTISRNDDYWNPDLPIRPATVKFTFVTDATAITQALTAGEIDGAYQLSSATVPTLQKSDAGQLVFGPSTELLALLIANPGGTTGDLKLREALTRIANRDAIADVVYRGAANPLYTTIPTTAWPNDERAIYKKAYKGFESSHAYDLDAAKSLIQESDYNGQELTLATLAGEESQNKVAQLIQQDAKKAGINIKIEPLQPLLFSQVGYDANKRKAYDLYLSASFSGVQDPLESLGFLYLPGSPYNYTDFDDPQVTKLLKDARAEFDAAKRAQMVVDAQEIYERSNIAIPIVSTYTTTFLNKRLTGAVTSFAYWSMPQMSYVGSAKAGE